MVKRFWLTAALTASASLWRGVQRRWQGAGNPGLLEEDGDRGQIPVGGGRHRRRQQGTASSTSSLATPGTMPPTWTKHDIRKPGEFGDGLRSYSEGEA